MKNPVVRIVLIVFVIAVLSLLAAHLYLLESNQGIQLHIGNWNIIRLGSPDAFFPSQFEQSFVPFSKDAPDIRKPRYERNTWYVSEDQGDILAKDMQSGQQSKFSWNDNTHYLCVSPANATVPGVKTKVDPAKELQNYVFLNTGNNIGGTSAADIGYYMFKRDVEKDTPIKFILENETLNNDGGYTILSAIVFTSHKTCVKPSDVIPDLPSD
ncbi:MAG TPA: hypothetical protein ACFYEK_15745 [Candidatus Wunengus sp. YC60]|uniref:hypothetical protein n=1 Tax=Candidatus Wunengus sp. YC60 TaxID=3367697 RepID=UPI004027CA02